MSEKIENKIGQLETSGREERIDFIVENVLKRIENVPAEKRFQEILNIIRSYGIDIKKEELEACMLIEEIVEEALEKGEISQEKERAIEKTIKENKNIGQWIKKILLIGVMLLAPLYNKNKDLSTAEKELVQKAKIETVKTSNTKKESLEKIPNDLEKPVNFFKNLEFIKGNFYVLDKSDKKKPTLYEITKEGRIVLKEIVGIGKEEGDQDEGYTTPAGIYMFSRWLHSEDIEIYKKNDNTCDIFRLLGYSINGKQTEDIGIHRVYPPEEKERIKKLLRTESSKRFSNRCINVEKSSFEKYISPSFNKAGGEGKLFLIIMQEKNAFDEEKWKTITPKMEHDVNIVLEK